MERLDSAKTCTKISEEERRAFMNRFKMACRNKGMTVAYLQAVLGKANAYFRNMGFISPKMAVEVKKYIPDLNIDYINNGVGSMYLTTAEVEEEHERMRKRIPVVPISARAGTLMAFADGLNREECETLLPPVEDAEMALTITNDSMAPEFSVGCIAFVKKANAKAFLEWGKVFVLDTCNGIVIKKIFPSKVEGRIVCRSTNAESYPDFEVAITDVYVFYKVVAQLRIM